MLSQRQQELQELVVLPFDAAPIADPEVVDALRSEIEGALAELACLFTQESPLWLGKRVLSAVFSCEGHLLAQDQEPFSWNRFNVKGTMLHWAIERELVPGPEKDPMDRVEGCFDHYCADPREGSIGELLIALSESESHELKSELNDLFVKFVTDWPDIPRNLAPRTESRISISFNDHRVVAEGRPDLIVGRPDGAKSTMVIIDFKSGQQGWRHLDDLRFYALLETFRSGAQPARIVSYYLNGGSIATEDVTEDVLRVAARRLVDGAKRIVTARAAGFDDVVKTVGPQCLWCALNDACPAYEESQV